MEFASIIECRRDGGRHTPEDLKMLADGAASGSIPDYQLSAWLMAAYLNPLDAGETAWLTQAMADSGDKLDLTGLPHPWVDKHSTGGVGDKTTIVLLPLLAACGLTIVKMSGRGLGMTGGTIDKLESVPGFRVDLDAQAMKEQAARIGLAITGQTPNLAPADKALYALRDVTGTVASIPLIVSSILSKKIAGGAEVIVLDVKCGSGAFMKTLESAHDLARGLSETASRCGLNARLAISDMEQPLGRAVGNSLEVAEALEILRCSNDLRAPGARLRRLCIELAALSLEAAGVCADHASATSRVERALSSGAAARKASEWFVAQGAADPFSPDFQMANAPVVLSVIAEEAGWIESIHAETVGQVVCRLGGGRSKKGDVIDHTVGLEFDVAIGSQVHKGDVLARVHAASSESGSAAVAEIAQAMCISPTAVDAVPALIQILS